MAVANGSGGGGGGSTAVAVESSNRGMVAGATSYYGEVVSEMRKVTWPDREQLKDTTIKIIVFVLILAAIIGLMDLLLQAVLVKGIPSLFTGR